MVTPAARVDLAELGQAFADNPYPAYARLREEAPIRRVVHYGLPGWMVTRHAELRQLLTDPRAANNPQLASPELRACAPNLFAYESVGFSPGKSTSLMHVDPPDHTRLRRLISREFTPRRISALRPRIQEMTDALIDAFAGRGTADLVDEFAAVLPCLVVMELLGVPAEDRVQFRRWSEIAASEPNDPREALEAWRHITKYFVELVAGKRERIAEGNPDDGLISALITLTDADQRLSEAEMTSTAMVLLIAGFETTMNLIGNGMLALLTHPDQLAELKADPSLVPTAVEEFLRYDSPVEMGIIRFAAEDIEAGGVTIAKGDAIFFTYNAANHDPERFGSPDDFDIHRDTSGHLAFGQGIRYCLGAPLARLEADIAFTTLVERLPDLALAVDPDRLRWRRSPYMRGLKRLPVTFTAGR